MVAGQFAEAADDMLRFLEKVAPYPVEGDEVSFLKDLEHFSPSGFYNF